VARRWRGASYAFCGERLIFVCVLRGIS